MPVEARNYVTPTEVENNYEYKLMKKVLRQEFPWIKDVSVPNDEEINKYNLIFLDIVIDPYILQKEIGLPLERWMKRYFKDPPSNTRYAKAPYIYSSSYLSTMFSGDRDITRELQDKVDATMKSVGRSAAIPEDLKIQKGRSFASGEYFIPVLEMPEDAFFLGD